MHIQEGRKPRSSLDPVLNNISILLLLPPDPVTSQRSDRMQDTRCSHHAHEHVVKIKYISVLRSQDGHKLTHS